MDTEHSKQPPQTIIDQQNRIYESLAFDDKADFANAERGRRGRLDPNVVKNADGTQVWNNNVYKFLQDDCPNSANPSLWRQLKLAHLDGLFHVTDCIYQVRGSDLSNVTIVETDKGLIIIDPLTSKETYCCPCLV